MEVVWGDSPYSIKVRRRHERTRRELKSILEESECFCGEWHSVVDLYKPLIATPPEVESRVVKTLNEWVVSDDDRG